MSASTKLWLSGFFAGIAVGYVLFHMLAKVPL